MKTMFKKIALCAMLVLILAPAAVMAAGQQGQGQGMCSEAGTCLNEHRAAIRLPKIRMAVIRLGPVNGDAVAPELLCDQTIDRRDGI
jgi:hypothetical protein